MDMPIATLISSTLSQSDRMQHIPPSFESFDILGVIMHPSQRGGVLLMQDLSRSRFMKSLWLFLIPGVRGSKG